MNAPTPISKLLVRKNQPIEAAHHNGLVKLAEAVTLQRGRLKGRQMPDGFTAHVEVIQPTSVNHPFKLFLEDLGNDKLSATFFPGHVNGVTPVINDVAIDGLTAAGGPPALEITDKAWADHGTAQRALVMLRYELDSGYQIKRVLPVALSEVPTAEDFVWHKLVAFLIRKDGEVKIHQQLFFSQYFTALNPRAGRFTPLARPAA